MRTYRTHGARIDIFSVICLGTFAVVIGMIAASLFYTPYSPTFMDAQARLQAPSLVHLFGTDNLGRDIFSRVMLGARMTFAVAAVVTLMGTVLGTALGALAGYLGGVVDGIFMRINDALLSIPGILTALVFVCLMSYSFTTMVLALLVIFLPAYVRLARASFAGQRSMLYVASAKAVGAGNMRIIGRHILPNVGHTLIASALIGFNNACMSEATLSYLGLGVQPPQASLGRMIQEYQVFVVSAPWCVLAPGIVLVCMIMGLREAARFFAQTLK